MPTEPNRHSHLRLNRHCIMPYQPLKPFTRLGQAVLNETNILTLLTPSRLVLPNWLSTMTKHLALMRTHLPCVSVDISCFPHLISWFQHPVLDPNEKLAHFRKHWGQDLQKEVLEVAEKIVWLLTLLNQLAYVCLSSSGNDMWSCMVHLVVHPSQPEKDVQRQIDFYESCLVGMKMKDMSHIHLLVTHQSRGWENSTSIFRFGMRFQKECHWYNGGGYVWVSTCSWCCYIQLSTRWINNAYQPGHLLLKTT